MNFNNYAPQSVSGTVKTSLRASIPGFGRVSASVLNSHSKVDLKMVHKHKEGLSNHASNTIQGQTLGFGRTLCKHTMIRKNNQMGSKWGQKEMGTAGKSSPSSGS